VKVVDVWEKENAEGARDRRRRRQGKKKNRKRQKKKNLMWRERRRNVHMEKPHGLGFSLKWPTHIKILIKKAMH